MEENKLVETEKVKKKSHFITDELNEILPIDTVAAVLGIFFAVCSMIYVLIRAYVPKDYLMLMMALAGVGTFLIMWVTFCVIAFLRRRNKAKESLAERKQKLIDQLHFCKECSMGKINDGFAYRKLVKEEEIEEIEDKLEMDLDPSKCNVLVYTSDLATLIRRLPIIKKNIEQFKVNYRVVYFDDHSDKYHNEIYSLIGAKNIMFAGSLDPNFIGYKDKDFFTMCDLDLIIYLDSSSYIQGFLSVDNVPFNAIDVGRSDHFTECYNRCNYGYTYSDGVVKPPFYKALDKEKVRALYKELDNCFKGGTRRD